MYRGLVKTAHVLLFSLAVSWVIDTCHVWLIIELKAPCHRYMRRRVSKGVPKLVLTICPHYCLLAILPTPCRFVSQAQRNTRMIQAFYGDRISTLAARDRPSLTLRTAMTMWSRTCNPTRSTIYKLTPTMKQEWTWKAIGKPLAVIRKCKVSGGDCYYGFLHYIKVDSDRLIVSV